MILSTENDNFLKKIVSGNPGTGEKILVAAADTVRIGSYGVEEESNLKFWEISAIETTVHLSDGKWLRSVVGSSIREIRTEVVYCTVRSSGYGKFCLNPCPAANSEIGDRCVQVVHCPFEAEVICGKSEAAEDEHLVIKVREKCSFFHIDDGQCIRNFDIRAFSISVFGFRECESVGGAVGAAHDISTVEAVVVTGGRIEETTTASAGVLVGGSGKRRKVVQDG